MYASLTHLSGVMLDDAMSEEVEEELRRDELTTALGELVFLTSTFWGF